MVNRRDARRSAAVVAAAGLGLALGLAAQSVVPGATDPRSWVPDLLVGWLLVTAGAVAWARGTVTRPAAVLTALAGTAWWSGNFAEVEVTWAAWVAAQLTFEHRALLVHAVLAARGALRDGDGRVLAVAAYVLAAPLPASGPAASAVIGVALLAVVLRRRNPGPGDAAPRAAVHVGVAGLVLATTLLVNAVQGLMDGSGGAWLLTYQTGVAACGLALTVPWRRRTNDEVTDLVVQLGGAGGGLGALLADLLDDPRVRLENVPTELVDDRRTELPPDSDYVTTAVRTYEDRTTLLVHRRALLDDPGLMASVVRAVGLLLDNERLQADLAARVGEVEASRTRLLRVADEESARLRARIHHGAGARLDRVVTELRRVDGAEPELRGLVAEAEERARQVRQDLADVEHALLPDLDRAPLATVLADLADASPLPVTLTADPGLRVPKDAAAVAWFVCAEGLTNVARHAGASRAKVTVAARSGRLLVTIEDDGAGLAGAGHSSGIHNLRDRVEAAGGDLRIGPGDDGGTVLAVELPLDGRHGRPAATSAGSRERR